jgi:hypothetical protein
MDVLVSAQEQQQVAASQMAATRESIRFIIPFFLSGQF